MNKEIVEYIEDSFIDYKGDERKFIVAAVSTPLKDVTISNGSSEIVKSLSIGFSICNSEDQFNSEIGLKIAINKATHANNSLKAYVSCAGMISTKVVHALLEQEVKYFKNNPDSHIPGYNEAKSKYFAKLELDKLKEEKFNRLDKEQQSIIEKLNSYSSEIRNIIKLFINEK